MAAGDVELPPKLGVHPRADGEIHAMPAYLKRADIAAIKWIAVYRRNKARGLPSINGLVIVSDPETRVPHEVGTSGGLWVRNPSVHANLGVREPKSGSCDVSVGRVRLWSGRGVAPTWLRVSGAVVACHPEGGLEGRAHSA